MGMIQEIPPSVLRAFEAAGRTRSFRTAAIELQLTPSAVSHAVRKLERTLGARLFERDGRLSRLTAEGEALMRHVGRAFDELRRDWRSSPPARPMMLRLHCAPRASLPRWLTATPLRFLRIHPGMEVRLAAGTDYTRFINDEFDADIIYGPPRQEGLVVVPLGEETVTPLCSPDLARRINAPIDLYPLCPDRERLQADPLAGVVCPQRAPGASAARDRFDRNFLAIAAAADGLGVALGRRSPSGRSQADASSAL